MQLRLARITNYLRSRLWFPPAVFVISAIVLSRLTLNLDDSISADRSEIYLFPGGPESARNLLSAIAGSMITFTAVVFSVTILVLQLASSQLSPRVMRTFLRDWITQVLLGMSIATFIFSLLILREVTGGIEGIPSLSIWTALLLTLISVGVFIAYIDHMAQSVRASTIIDRVASETRGAVDRLYPEAFRNDTDDEAQYPEGPWKKVTNEGAGGVVAVVDEHELAHLATENDMVIRLVPYVGDFVPHGAPLFHVWHGDDMDETALRGTVGLAKDRSMEQDVAFGLRQLVDIGERALSPGTNDPTTAVQALDQIHDLLRRLVQRDIPSPMRFDETSHLRLILPRPGWTDYVTLGLDEIRQYGSGSIQVMRRLEYLIDDLLSVAAPSRQAIVLEQLELLEQARVRGFASYGEVRTSRNASAQGHGPVDETPEPEGRARAYERSTG